MIRSVIKKVTAPLSYVESDRYFLTGGLCDDSYLRKQLELALHAYAETAPLARYAGAIGAALLTAVCAAVLCSVMGKIYFQ